MYLWETCHNWVNVCFFMHRHQSKGTESVPWQCASCVCFETFSAETDLSHSQVLTRKVHRILTAMVICGKMMGSTQANMLSSGCGLGVKPIIWGLWKISLRNFDQLTWNVVNWYGSMSGNLPILQYEKLNRFTFLNATIFMFNTIAQLCIHLIQLYLPSIHVSACNNIICTLNIFTFNTTRCVSAFNTTINIQYNHVQIV